MTSYDHIAVVGATSAIAQHCLHLWLLERPRKVTLIGRSAERLERVRRDALVRSPDTEIAVIAGDLVERSSIEVICEQLFSSTCDLVLVAHGLLSSQDECQQYLDKAEQSLQINGVSQVLFAEAVASRLDAQGHGTLAVIGSVAGDRGRKSNYVYGAAKGLVSRYMQGLQHRFAGRPVRCILIKPGPTDTPMTSEFKASGMALAPVEQVASVIVSGINKDEPTIYAPRKWRAIMLIIQHLPSQIFNRLNI